MKCELCNNTATEKHHLSYFPERTMGVCGFHGDEIHRNPALVHLVRYPNGDAKTFYSQAKRISSFLRRLSMDRKNEKRLRRTRRR
jgi:hypothetical protein